MRNSREDPTESDDDPEGNGTSDPRVEDGGNERERGRWTKRAIVCLGVIALLLVGAGVTARMIFTPEKLTSMVVPRLQEAAGREVKVSTVRLKLLPLPAVRLEDFALAAGRGFGPEPALEGRAVDVQIALLPLLTGEVSVKRVRLLEPTLRYLVAEDGTHTFTGLGAAGAEDEAPGEEEDGTALSISDFRVEGGRVLYDDRRAGRGARFGMSGDVSASMGGETAPVVVSEGDLRIDSLRALLPELREDSLRITSFRMAYDGSLVTGADSLALDRFELSVDEVSLSARGSLAWSDGTPRGNLRLETGKTDVEALRRMVPQLDLGDLRPRGRVRLTARVEGPLDPENLPRIEGTATLEDMALAYAGREGFVSEMGGEIAFTGSSARTEGLEGKLLGRDFRVAGTISDFETLTADLRIEGAGDLQRLREVLPEDLAGGELGRYDPRGDIRFSLRVRGPLGGEAKPEVSGEARVSGFAADYAEVEGLIDQASATLAFTGNSLAVRDFEGRLLGRPLSLGLQVRNFDAPTVEGRAEGSVDLGRALPLLPAELPEGLAASGRLDFSVRASGRVGEGRMPDLQGEGTLSGFSAAYAGVDDLVRNAEAAVALSGESVRVTSFRGSVLGRPMQGRLTYMPGEPAQVEGRLNGQLDLERLSRVQARLAEASGGESEPPRPMAGTATVDLAFEGRLEGLSGLTLEGPVTLSDFRYETPALAAPLRIASGTVRLEGSGLRTEGLTMRVGETDLTLTATARNVLPLSRLEEEPRAGQPRPTVDFRLDSRRLLLDQLLPAPAEGDTGPTYSEVLKAHLSGDPVAGASPDAIARDRFPLPELPRLNATGRIEVGEVINPPTRMENLAFDVRLERGSLRVSDVRAGLYGGRLSGGVTAELGGDDRRSPVSFQVALQDADAAAFMGRWTKLEQALTGRLDISIDGRTLFDHTLLPVTEQTDAEGRILVRNGSMENMVPMQGVVRAIGVSPAQVARFDSLGGPFRVRDGRLELLNWTMDSQSPASASMQGSVAFAGPLDLDMNLSVPLSMLQGSPLMQLTGGGGGLLGRFMGNAAGSDEIIDIPISIGGTMSEPAVRVDERAFAVGLQSLLRSVGGKEGGGLLQGLLGGGRKQEEEKEEGGGGGLLDRFLKRGSGGSDTSGTGGSGGG